MPSIQPMVVSARLAEAIITTLVNRDQFTQPSNTASIKYFLAIKPSLGLLWGPKLMAMTKPLPEATIST